MTITVVAKKLDDAGDVGYVLNVVNKTDSKVYVYADPGWMVNGSPVSDAILRAEVLANDDAEVFMWFDSDESGLNSLETLKAVEGTIVVEAHDTGRTVGEYVISA